MMRRMPRQLKDIMMITHHMMRSRAETGAVLV